MSSALAELKTHSSPFWLVFITWLWNMQRETRLKFVCICTRYLAKQVIHLFVQWCSINGIKYWFFFWNLQIKGHVCCWKALTASGMGWAWYPCDWHATWDRRHPTVNLTVNTHFRSVLNMKWNEWSKGKYCV